MVATVEYKTADNYLQLLSALNRETRLYVVSKLTEALFNEEAAALAATAYSARRKARVVCRHTSSTPSDEELSSLFSDKDMPHYPESEPSLEEVIRSNAGRTIKPVEKWL